MKKRHLIFLASGMIAAGLVFAGCGGGTPDEDTSSVTVITKENVLESLREARLIKDETLEDGTTVMHTYSNGTTATIKDSKVTLRAQDSVFECEISEYLSVISDKSLETEDPVSPDSTETTPSESDTEQTSTTPSTPSVASSTTRAGDKGSLATTSAPEGTWVQFDDGTMKYYGPEETFHFVDSTGTEYTFNYDEWQEFQKTGKLPDNK